MPFNKQLLMYSALSLRLFGTDITVAGRQAAKRQGEGTTPTEDDGLIKNSVDLDDDDFGDF